VGVLLITGSEGFLGWHLRCAVKALGTWDVRAVGREGFWEGGRLVESVASADAVVHLAGMNRGEETQIESTNVALTERLVDALGQSGRAPHVVFANSTHVGRNTAYGRSKRRSADALAAWCDRNGAHFTNLIFPQVFGEGGRPFYNSVVATFCHQLACGEQPRVLEDAELELLHAQAAAETMLAVIEQAQTGDRRIGGFPLRVSALLEHLRRLHDTYCAGVLPDLSGELTLALFNTLRASMFPTAYPVQLDVRSDARGRLFEGVKTVHGGQCFISTTHPGITRGNHFHRFKVERFLVLEGRAVIRVRRLFQGQVYEFGVSGDNPAYIDMPTLATHAIKNIGKRPLVTLFWAHEFFDAGRPDTYTEEV